MVSAYGAIDEEEEMKATSWRRAAAAALAAGLLVAACGGSSESPAAGNELTTDPVTLTIQIFNAGGQAELEYRQAQAADFTALHPNVTVELVQSGNYIDTVLPQIAAGTVGDVIWPTRTLASPSSPLRVRLSHSTASLQRMATT